MIRIAKKIDLIYTIVLFASILYFSLSAIFGVSRADSEEGAGASYVVYCILVFSLFLIVFMGKHLRYVDKKGVKSILILFVYIVSGVIAGYIRDKAFLCLGAFCVPSALIAIYYAHIRDINGIVQWIEVFLPVISLSMVYQVLELASIYTTEEIHYSQSLSYYAALCFLLVIFYIKYGDGFERFKVFKSSLFKYFYYLLLLYYVLIMFVGGGRGAVVAAFLGLAYMFFSYKKNPVTLVIKVLFISFAVYIVVIILDKFVTGDLLQTFMRNFSRISGFLTGEIDLSDSSSGRDIIYQKSWQLFKDSPLWGYGLFGYRKVLGGYPHNIFLEILLQGGLILFMIFTFVMIAFINKLKRIISENKRCIFLLPLTIYPFTELLFSGTYVENPFFWFTLVFVFNYRLSTRTKVVNTV